VGGRALAQVAANRPDPIPVFAEMSSVNPVFLLPGAVAAQAAELAAGLHASVTQGVGQFCTNPGLVVAQRSPHLQSLLDLLNQRLSDSPAGVMLSRAVAANYAAGLTRLAGRPGVKRLSAPEAFAALCWVEAKNFLEDPCLGEEVFGPSTLVVECAGRDEMLAVARCLEGQLSASIHATESERTDYADLVGVLEAKAGRLVFGGFPTGVEVCDAMVHGGPQPATWDGSSTSVGTRAILRFTRPVCFQDFPEALLPAELKDGNPLGIDRMIDGRRVSPGEKPK
jgi:alpha-ketoglutaric semialdehyde dehydrogenase